MLDLEKRPHSLIENFKALGSLLATYGPDELHILRERAFRAFEASGFPTSKDEEFKYTTLRVLEEGVFAPAYGATVTRHELEQTALGRVDALTVTFVNGQYAPELSSAHALPAGVFVGSLQDGFEVYRDLILKHLGKVASLADKLGTTNDERFVHLNTAFISEGAFVFVPVGVALERPIHLLYLNRADHGAFVSHPRNLIVLEENAQAKIVESYIGTQGTVFTNAVTEIALGKSANLEHTKFQQETLSSVHIANISIHQDSSSVYAGMNGSFGAQISRTEVNAWVDGEHTETTLDGTYVGMGDQVVDTHTRIDHAKPNCHSFEVYKGILGGRALGVFNGKIFVYLDAQKTDAKQTNQAILLSPTATINTKPQLEIFADDVKCTHGATVGQLREDALFYLRARGIPLKQARGLLVYAFAAEVIEKISIKDVREAIEKVLFDRLQEVEELPEVETMGE